ncbi:hypothetical protein R1flu_000400 [Riccia fluitans]|uniref:Uncharacterized protein n=1 Tax=Riccia fluitans TaxID=41844 RepID=A0ABD1Y0T6_9MARC
MASRKVNVRSVQTLLEESMAKMRECQELLNRKRNDMEQITWEEVNNRLGVAMEKSQKVAEELHILVMAEDQAEMNYDDSFEERMLELRGKDNEGTDYFLHNGGKSDVDTNDDCRCSTCLS